MCVSMKEPTPDWILEGQGSDQFYGGQVVRMAVCQMGWSLCNVFTAGKWVPWTRGLSG